MSQFIEMFGNPVANNKGWSTMAIKQVAPEEPSRERQTGTVWILNLDMIESHTGKIIDKVYDEDTNLLSVAPFDEGNVLYSKLRPYLNKVVIPKGKGYATTELVPLRPNQEYLNLTFFSYLLRGDDFVTYANTISSGTKMPRMPLNDLRNFQCILPPMQEQLKFEKVAEQADKSKFVGFKSQFIEMFEDHNYTSVPLAELIDKSFPGEWGTEDENGNGTKVIRTTNITNSDKLDLSDVVTRNIVAAKLQKKQLCRGDILLERSGGTKDNPVGRVAYFDEDGVFVTNNFTQTLRCNNNIESRYLFYFLYYFYNLNKMKIRSMGNQTTGIQNLNMDDYMQISVIVPPRDLQKQFISIVTQADKSKLVLLQIVKSLNYNIN